MDLIPCSVAWLRHRQLTHRPSYTLDASPALRTSAYCYPLGADEPPVASNTSSVLPGLSHEMPQKIHPLAMVAGQFSLSTW
ncbi:unnamed protein product [Gulo gulo]|uniref:Uncharacterized protein n=1 Tax=Gulo gulo TaxID=48420 RepID=A0A9X9LXQ4_GULGU|nr:unnamed protein product [Gulo gulo]